MDARPSWLVRSEYPFRSRFLEVEGERIHYVDEGSGPTLLFVHAGPVWSFIFRGQIEALRNEYRCVAIDFPASGLSPASASYRPTLRSAARIFESFGHALDLRDVTLVLHDLGAPVALSVAARTPERFSAIVAMECFAWPLAGRHPRVMRMLRLAGSPPFRALNDFANLVGRASVTRFAMGRSLTAAGRATFLGPYHDRRVRRAAAAMLADAAASTELLAELDAVAPRAFADRPVLLVFGEHSPTMQERFPAHWMERFPQATLVTVPEAHHFPMVDSPELVSTAMRRWLATNQLPNSRLIPIF